MSAFRCKIRCEVDTDLSHHRDTFSIESTSFQVPASQAQAQPTRDKSSPLLKGRRFINFLLLAARCLKEIVEHPDFLRRDVAEMAKVGSSEFGLLGYQSCGGLQTNTGGVLVDPTDVAFGSDAFERDGDVHTGSKTQWSYDRPHSWLN
ncbi:hypothetical protein PM082_008250 [Marasmius tenuissimus]|nr:hypothetical protein PM082_008250 [Marasmius tenuissimus]